MPTPTEALDLPDDAWSLGAKLTPGPAFTRPDHLTAAPRFERTRLFLGAPTKDLPRGEAVCTPVKGRIRHAGYFVGGVCQLCGGAR